MNVSFQCTRKVGLNRDTKNKNRKYRRYAPRALSTLGLLCLLVQLEMHVLSFIVQGTLTLVAPEHLHLVPWGPAKALRPIALNWLLSNPTVADDSDLLIIASLVLSLLYLE